jgi:pimeloyl-ACP methyl ester carboxylesterase
MLYTSLDPKNKHNLILLHGWGGCWQSWYPIIERLKNNYNLYVPDLPGFGQNEIKEPLLFKDYTDFLVDFVKKNKIKNPILIGHSFGGAIAAKAAAEKLIPITKLILVDAAAIRHPYSPKQQVTINLISSIKKILSLPLINKVLPAVQKTYYQVSGQENSDYAALKDNPKLQKTFQNVIQHDLTDILSKIKTPTLIIWGEKDLATPLEDGQKIHQLINKSKFIILPNSTHFSYLEKQQEFVNEVTKFI